MRKTLRQFCFVALAVLVLAPLGGIAQAKDRPENDCLIGIVDADGNRLSGDVSCTDCDPTCDVDGVASANGSCQFKVQACLDIGGVSGCTQRPLKKVKIKTQFKPNEISVSPVTGSTSSVCGSFVNFQVNLKKKGKKKGTRNVIAMATADVKPAGKNKDRDHVRFVCLPRPAGQACPTTTTTTSSTLVIVTTTSTTTSTTVPTCGDGTKNGTEACDPKANPTGCAGGETCMPAGALSECTCKTCTTATQDTLTFTTGTAVASNCGDAGLVNPPVGPTCGKIIADDASQVALGCGCLYIGGGNSTVPGGATPDGSSSILSVVASCGTELQLGPSAQGTAGQNACTTGAGPGKACINDVTHLADINNLQTCTTDDDCPKTGAGTTTALGSCVDKPNCLFGPPLPIKNGTLSTCVINTFGVDAGGSVDPVAGNAGVSYPLRSHTFLTGNGSSPCPTCVAGQCTAGARVGLACSNPVGTTMVTPECPPNATGGAYLPEFSVTLSPLTTALSSKQNTGGIFCPAQQTKSAFGTQAASVKRNIVEIQQTGVAAGNITDGLTHASTLGAVFCIPATGNGLIDGAADLAGPGSVSLPGTVQLQ